MTVAEETPAVETKTEKPTLEQLLKQYVDLQANRANISPEEFDQQGRTLRRKIRALGGSVNTLKPAAESAEAKAAKPAKEGKAKKSKAARVEAGLEGTSKAPPAGRAYVDWFEKVMSGTEQLGEDPQITPLTQRSMEDLEGTGDYGLGFDLMSDTLVRQVIAKFEDRFGYTPSWFAINRPESYEAPNALTLLVLGPVPEGAATEEPVAATPDESAHEVESEANADDEDEDEAEGDEEGWPED